MILPNGAAAAMVQMLCVVDTRWYLQRGREGGRSSRSKDRGFRPERRFSRRFAYRGSSEPVATTELALEAGALPGPVVVVECGGRLMCGTTSPSPERGGVHVPSAVGFETHSDGDVLSHAMVDALAGAIADGDLGTHFPEDDPEAQDARSLDFLPHMVRLVRAEGYEIANVDSFVVLGTPKLRPHLDGMRRNLAAALDIDVKQVSVKARSNDGLGDAGTGRACEAWATVLIYPAID